MKGIFKLAVAVLACLPLMWAVQPACATEWTPEMVATLKAQAKKGDKKAQLVLGGQYERGIDGLPQDYSQALYWYEKAARQGEKMAQCALGYMYGEGRGVRQNFSQALYWFEKAARQGYAPAQGGLGVMYHNGWGVRQNKSVAKEWFGKGCDGGDQASCDRYRRLNEAGF